MTTNHVEIERKYEVATDVALPDLRGLPKVASVETVLTSSLEAIYSDTDELTLASAGITLRRRTGGSDAGWHLKLPGGGDDRSELAEPLRDDDDSVPAELLAHVRAYVRDRDLLPVATISTSRVVHRLIGSRGKVLAEVSDDLVTAQATSRHGEAMLSNWREWEIELVDGSRKLLTAAEDLFGSAGARRSEWPSKLHHALNRQPATVPARGDRTAGAVVHSYLADQVAVILHRDAQVRLGEPDAVHKSRVATRRLRSSLSTFRPLFDREVTDPIRAELKWLAESLGRVRDIEVQRAHLLEAVAAEPPDLVMGQVASRIQVELGSDLQVARQKLLEDLESTRYFRLLDTLDDLVATPPFSELAGAKPRALLEKRVRAATRRMLGLVRGGPAHGSTEDHWLHEIRKAAKRVRYAAEAAAPVLGRKAAALAEDAEQIQETLGAHQDSVVTRSTLRGIAVRSHLDGENAFTTGRLHALEQARAQDSRDAFLQAWSNDYLRRLKDWRHS